jgi:MFS superfamily sulfate permease-like transporter
MQIKQNLTAGFLASFIALPLCIAIASAPEFPVLSGIITAIIGGILVSQISGSHLTINGPAAGMIVVIIDAVEKLGNGDLVLGYKYTLGAIVCASLLQIAISFTKFPNLMRKFPETIIRGMMMAIGLIVITKQIFVLNGFKPVAVNIVNLFNYVPQSFMGMQLKSFLLGAFTILLIIFWKKLTQIHNIFKIIPVHLVAIILGGLIATIYDFHQHQHFLNNLVSRPMSSSFVDIPSNLKSAFRLPDFSIIFSLKFWLATLTIFGVGSLETMLSAIAVDKIDPQKRQTNLSKDIRAIGIGNVICGMVGALPMIAEIVRSNANVNYGATNKSANFFHGLALLLMITIFSDLLKFIPLCVLAGMLILIGFNMLNLKLFLKIFQESKIDFLAILVVIFFTLKIDLLAGIFIGLIFLIAVQYLKRKNVIKKI